MNALKHGVSIHLLIGVWRNRFAISLRNLGLKFSNSSRGDLGEHCKCHEAGNEA